MIGFTRETFGFTLETIGFTRKTLDFTRKTFDFTRKTVIYDTNGLPYTCHAHIHVTGPDIHTCKLHIEKHKSKTMEL